MQTFGFSLDHLKPVVEYRREGSRGTLKVEGLKETLEDRTRKTLGEETLL